MCASLKIDVWLVGCVLLLCVQAEALMKEFEEVYSALASELPDPCHDAEREWWPNLGWARLYVCIYIAC